MGALRWHFILMAQGFSIPLHRVFRIFFIGVFFNAFMLGACGGDLARAVYVTLEVPGRRTEAAATALIDRIVGLLSMILFCCVIFLARWPVFWNRMGTKGPALLILVFFVLSLAGVAFIFSHNLFERWAFVRRIEEKTYIGPRLRRVYNAFYLYRRRKRVLILAGLFSAINMIMQTLACVLFGVSLGLTLNVLDYFTVVPIIIILSSIPITPGALGIREGLFVHMFQIFNVSAAHSLPLAVMLFMGGVCWSVFGGVLFMLHSASSGHTVREEIARLNEERDTPPADAAVFMRVEETP